MTFNSIEKIVREHDRDDLTITKSARRLSEEYGFKFSTCQNYLVAKRRGFKSFKDYQIFLRIKKNSFSTKLTKINGFKKTMQEIFEEEKIVYWRGNSRLDALGGNYIPDKLELNDSIRELVEELPERLKTVIVGRYFEGRKLIEIKKIIDANSRQYVKYLEQKALTFLERRARVKGLDSYLREVA